MRRFYSLVVLALLVAASARSESLDDQYVRIYFLIQDADSSEESQPTQALAAYRNALTALQRFQSLNPNWNAQVVKFRINYVAAKVAALSQRMAAAPAQAKSPVAAPAGASPPPADWQNQLAALRDQVRELQAEKTGLEAKLKEALSVQPARLDSRQLAAADATIKSLEKENDLLHVRLDEEKSRTAPAVETRAYALARQSLAETSRQLDAQTRRADALARDKQFLEAKLSVLAPMAENAAALAAARKALADANTKLASQTEIASRLAREKDALLSRVKELSSENQALAALRADNEILKKQLAESKATPPAGRSADADRKLTDAQSQVAALQSDKEVLRLQNLALQQQLAARPAPAPDAASASPTLPNTAPPAAGRPEDLARIKQLEQERDALLGRLDAAIKGASGRKGREASARVDGLEAQLVALRARLDVYEARPVPYTPEELALFQKPAPKLEEGSSKAGEASPTQLAADTRALMADAQRHFARNELDQAEADYVQALRQNKKNVVMLADLATIEMERNHLDDAEKHAREALDIAPNDAFSLLALGQVQFRQEKYKEALDVLSRAANLDSQNPEIQNYLGITLSQLGMRGPAETALRKAIQIDPNHAGAHHNLAVIYITQKPPLVELARWHYQKALAAGHPRNPELEKLFVIPGPVE